jgi:hypothetical protein
MTVQRLDPVDSLRYQYPLPGCADRHDTWQLIRITEIMLEHQITTSDSTCRQHLQNLNQS